MLRSDDVDKGAKRTEHENRFDRQLRLWGGHGQKLLESAHICALGSGPTVSECLKNLVLPNIAKFTIIDDKKVQASDNANNFFVDDTDIGQQRGAAVMEKLLEMNPWDEKKKFGVRGHHISKNADKMIEEDSLDPFKEYTIIIASEISETNMLKLADFCYQHNILFVLVQVNGLIGYVRWTKREHCIAESHPVNIDTSDVRIFPQQLSGFPELSEFVGAFDFKQLRKDKMKHRHIPWPVIVHHQLCEWVGKHDGQLPKNFDERSDFKEQIKKASLSYGMELNFQEAVKNAHKACIKPHLSPEAQEVLDDPKAKEIGAESTPFWMVVNAINQFKQNEGNGFLPVNASIPDMTALPELYVALQKIFQARERKDLDVVHKYVRQALASAGRPEDSVGRAYVDRVAKHIRTAAVVRCNPLDTEYDVKKADFDNINEIFEEWEEAPEWDEEEMGCPPPLRPKNIYWYFGLRAVERFRASNEGRYPGALGHDFEEDVKTLVDIQNEMFSEYKIRSKVEPAVLRELCRFAGKEIHNTAAMIGGVASQVCLKLIVRQFVPFDNTFVFNGIHSTANVYRL